jgi:predicted nuclease with TOPRIM domain
MNITLESLKEIIGGLYVENVLLTETVRQLQAENAAQKKRIAELEKPQDSGQSLP